MQHTTFLHSAPAPAVIGERRKFNRIYSCCLLAKCGKEISNACPTKVDMWRHIENKSKLANICSGFTPHMADDNAVTRNIHTVLIAVVADWCRLEYKYNILSAIAQKKTHNH